MAYFKIGNTDLSKYVSALKVGTETIVSDDSGRNANGDTVLDIVTTKKKVYITFRPMFDSEMIEVMTAVNPFVITVQYRDPLTGSLDTITCYTGTPEPEYYTIQQGKVLYKPMNLNFIEM